MAMTFGDGARAQLRTLVETMDRELARSPDAASSDVRARWGELVTALALGPAPETRECPHCGEVGMRAASRCARCWAALVPGN